MAQYKSERIIIKDGRELVLRHCTPKDAVCFPEFQKTIARETTHTLQGEFNTPAVDATQKRWEASEKNLRALDLGAFDSTGKLVGILGLRAEWDGHPWITHVGDFGMMIIKDYWGQGLARRMMEILEEFAKQSDYKRIQGLVREQNNRGLKLYKANGFFVEGTRKKAVLIDGEWLDELYIAKLYE